MFRHPSLPSAAWDRLSLVGTRRITGICRRALFGSFFSNFDFRILDSTEQKTQREDKAEKKIKSERRGAAREEECACAKHPGRREGLRPLLPPSLRWVFPHDVSSPLIVQPLLSLRHRHRRSFFFLPLLLHCRGPIGAARHGQPRGNAPRPAGPEPDLGQSRVEGKWHPDGTDCIALWLRLVSLDLASNTVLNSLDMSFSAGAPSRRARITRASPATPSS